MGRVVAWTGDACSPSFPPFPSRASGATHRRGAEAGGPKYRPRRSRALARVFSPGLLAAPVSQVHHITSPPCEPDDIARWRYRIRVTVRRVHPPSDVFSRWNRNERRHAIPVPSPERPQGTEQLACEPRADDSPTGERPCQVDPMPSSADSNWRSSEFTGRRTIGCPGVRGIRRKSRPCHASPSQPGDDTSPGALPSLMIIVYWPR